MPADAKGGEGVFGGPRTEEELSSDGSADYLTDEPGSDTEEDARFPDAHVDYTGYLDPAGVGVSGVHPASSAEVDPLAGFGTVVEGENVGGDGAEYLT